MCSEFGIRESCKGGEPCFGSAIITPVPSDHNQLITADVVSLILWQSLTHSGSPQGRFLASARAAFRLVLFQLRHLPFHEVAKQRDREGCLSMPLTPDHA